MYTCTYHRYYIYSFFRFLTREEAQRRKVQRFKFIKVPSSFKIRMPECFHHLRNIAKIKRYLKDNQSQKLVHAFVSSKLDYCNAISFGIKSTTTFLDTYCLVQGCHSSVLSAFSAFWGSKSTHKVVIYQKLYIFFEIPRFFASTCWHFC